MKQQKFIVASAKLGSGTVMAGSFATAIAKSGFKPEEVISVAAVAKFQSAEGLAKIMASVVGTRFELAGPSFTVTAKTLDAFNDVLEALGYKPVKVTHNMLNEAAGEFLIDADTPSYCDPACESYHSM